MGFIKYVIGKPFKRAYSFELYSSYEYEILNYFLYGELNFNSKFYKDWIYNTDKIGICGNWVFLKRDKQNIVLFYDPSTMSMEDNIELDSDINISAIKYKFVIPRDDFVHILDEFIRFTDRGYDEIWIKNEGNIFWLEGVK